MHALPRYHAVHATRGRLLTCPVLPVRGWLAHWLAHWQCTTCHPLQLLALYRLPKTASSLEFQLTVPSHHMNRAEIIGIYECRPCLACLPGYYGEYGLARRVGMGWLAMGSKAVIGNDPVVEALRLQLLSGLLIRALLQWEYLAASHWCPPPPGEGQVLAHALHGSTAASLRPCGRVLCRACM